MTCVFFYVQHARLDVDLLILAQHSECFGVLLLERGEDKRTVGTHIIRKIGGLLQINRETIDGRGRRGAGEACSRRLRLNQREGIDGWRIERQWLRLARRLRQCRML